VVPDWPHRHLDDPSYLGVIAFLVLVGLVLSADVRAWRPSGGGRRLIRLLLVGLPVIYVGNRLRWGGSGPELAVELLGLAVWVGFARQAGKHEHALWLGCVAHALWDVLHFQQVAYVPDWYVLACVAADLGLGAFVLLALAEARST
jgi:hypothetical protein